MLKALALLPRFPGKDRLTSRVVRSFSSRAFPLSDGIFLHLDCSEWIQADLLVNGEIEPRTIALMRRLIDKGDCVVDVGAHIGYHAVHAGRLCGDGVVLAIDPQPYNADRIMRNAACNGLRNIRVICAAVSNVDGYITLPFQDEHDRSRLSIAGGGPNDLTQTVEVPLRSLAEILLHHGIDKVKLLKIDVEGAESDVIRSLGDKVGLCENIVFESLPDENDRNREILMGLVRSAGFELCDVDGQPYDPQRPLVENNCWARRTACTDANATT